ncbi:MAG: ABC transporter substrate-binding protein [Deltaproteobacteria bacterium]|nr:ABC transporter substrate-binding protein [Deltaproteobacteria bacterium]
MTLVLFQSSGAQMLPEKKIVLGVATSLAFLEGRESLMAVELAVDEINQQGGIRIGPERYALGIESIDLRGADPNVQVSDALQHFEEFIREKKPHGIIVGPFRSEVMTLAMDIIAKYRIPLLGNIAMSPITEAKILTDPHYKYVFRVGLNTQYLVEYLVNAMKFFRSTYGFDKVSIMVQDVVWAKTTASQLVKLYFAQSDWRIIGLHHYSPVTVDFSPGLSMANDSGAHIILTLFDRPESAELVRQWKRLSPRSLLLGFISPLVGPSAWNFFDGQIADALTVIFELGNIPARRWEPATNFFNAFKEKFGREIEAGHGPAPAYEAVHIFVEAVKKAGCLESDKIVTALEQTDRYGAMGRIRFHRGHQVVFGNEPSETALACIVQWQADGRRKIIYPLSIAESTIEIPFQAPY